MPEFDELMTLIPGGELMDDNAETWFSLPVGHLVAIEVEHYRHEAKPFHVWLRRWAMDHGLNSEDELGSAVTEAEAADIVKSKLAEMEADDRAERETFAAMEYEQEIAWRLEDERTTAEALGL